MSELDAILDGNEESDVQTTDETITDVSTDQNTETAESEADDAKGDKEDSTPESKDGSDDSKWQYEAYKEEKRKRQELQKEIESLKTPKEPVKAPDVFEDQEAYNQHIAQQIETSMLNNRADLSQFHAEREFGKDVVAEKLEAFKGLIAENPALAQQVNTSVSPYHEMIEVVDKAEKLKAMENVDDWEKKKEAEIEARIRAELENEIAQKESKRSSVTPSLNNQAAASDKTQSGGSDSLADILGR